MNPKYLSILGIALLFATQAPAAEAPGKGKQKKELTREEIAKLGGFEPAPEAEPDVPLNVQIEMIVVAVPKDIVLSLSDGLKNPETADASYRELTGMIKAKKAKLLGAPSVTTKPGNRCVIELIKEVRYAIEFDPNGGGKAPGPQPAEKEAVPAKRLPQEAPPAIGVTPTTFETRNIGITLEVEPILHPGNKVVDLQYAAQHVELIGWDSVEVEENGKVVQRTPQPRFHTNKVATNVSMPVGKRALAGVFDSAFDPETMELFIMRTTTVPAAAGKKK